MAPRHEAPRLPGLCQTRGRAQEKPIELPAVAAAAAAGAAAAQADDAQEREARPARGRRGLMTSGPARQHGVRDAERGGEGVHRARHPGSSRSGAGVGRPVFLALRVAAGPGAPLGSNSSAAGVGRRKPAAWAR